MSIYVIGHKTPDSDSVCAAIALAHYKRAIPAISGNPTDETKYILDVARVDIPQTYTHKQKDDKFILVDHHQISDSIEGLESSDILEIIDHHIIVEHHPNTTFEPVGSTCTIVAQMIEDIPQHIAILLIGGIISDTKNLLSATTKQLDIDTVKRLSNIAKIDIEGFCKNIMIKKTTISNKDTHTLLMDNHKMYQINDFDICICSVNVYDMDQIYGRMVDITTEIENIITKRSLDALMLMVKDLLNEKSHIYVFGNKKSFLKRKLNINEDSVTFDSVVSRKLHIVPMLYAKGK